MSRIIQVVNQQTAIGAAEVGAATTAIQTQLTDHLCPAYGRSPVTLQLGGETAAERIYLLDNTDQADALGYHEDTAGNVPVGYVFVQTAIGAGVPWTVPLSHEVCEQVVDPFTTDTMLAVFLAQVAAVAREVSDPVEGQTYRIGGVTVSNFVLPSWFIVGAPGPFDFLKQLAAPLTIGPGGYVAYTTTLRAWQEAFGYRAPKKQTAPARFSRRARRQMRLP